MRMRTRLALAVALLAVAAVPAGASAAEIRERVIQFQTVADSSVASHPAACPFEGEPYPVLFLGARTYWYKLNSETGEVKSPKTPVVVGEGAACLQLTEPHFAVESHIGFYGELNLNAGRYVLRGTCEVASNTVPVPGIILTSCNLRILSGPAGTIGGLATSASVFNPLKLPGYSTGSFWTLRVYYEAAPNTTAHVRRLNRSRKAASRR